MKNSKQDINKKEVPKSQAKGLVHEVNRTDFKIGLLLFLLALCTRFFRLGLPKAVVFDEGHFGKFVNWTFKREFYYDIHPPLGKLVLALSGLFVGYYPRENFNYEDIGHEFGDTLYYPLREVAAFLGSCIVPTIYFCAREMMLRRTASILVATMVLFDTLLIVESRLILIDSQLILFSATSLLCALKMWKTRKGSVGQRWKWLLLTAVNCGLVISIKHTGIGTPGLIAVVSGLGLYFVDEPLSLIELVVAALVMSSLYVLFFYIQFKIAIYTGHGDVYMSQEFQQGIIGNRFYLPIGPYKSFFKKFLEMNKRMVQGNASVPGGHSWESTWYQWIINWRGMLYYWKWDPEARKIIQIYLIGNPAVIWGCFIGICLFFTIVLGRIRYRWHFTEKMKVHSAMPNDWIHLGVFLSCGWVCNLIPYILVDRSAFLYHYLPGLMYAELLGGHILNLLRPPFDRILCVILIICIFGCYLCFAPWVYAIPLTEQQNLARKWMPRWF